MADMTTIKGRIAETIYPNGTGAITAEKHQALLLEMVDDINEKKADKEEVTAVAESVSTLSQEVESNRVNLTESINALEQKVDNLPQGEEFDAEGNYPSLRVGTADTAIDLAGRGESVPAEFGFRASGGKSIKDGRAYIKRIKGNSVVWNMIMLPNQPRTHVSNGITGVWDGAVLQLQGTIEEDGYVSLYSPVIDDAMRNFFALNHKYAVVGTSANFKVHVYSGVSVEGTDVITKKVGDTMRIAIRSQSAITAGTVINESIAPRIYDLTKMFQAGNEPTTIEDFNTRVATLGVDMNAYNEGQVIHCNTESIKSVGDNAWDEEWELGTLNSTGVPSPNDTRIRSKNFTRVIPNETYYFYGTFGYGIYFYDEDKNYVTTLYVNNNKLQIPSNAMYLKFNFPTDYGTTYKGDYMLTLVHSGWKQDTDAGYQPYWQDILPLPIINKYFPDGMKSAGSAHDEIRYNKSSGKWEAVQRIGVVDLGTLKWQIENTESSTDIRFVSRALDNIKTVPSGEQANILCAKYGSVRAFDTYKAIQGVAVKADSKISIYDASYTDAASLKASLQGVILYYELAGPIVTELDAEDQNFRDYYNVADFGTEEAISKVASTPFSADIIYQFNAVDMIREHEIEITELQSIIATMQAQLTSLINGGQ